MRRTKTGRSGGASERLERLKAQEERLRQQRIAILRGELVKARETVQTLERELRLLGDHETTQSVGRIAWEEVYRRLGDRFTTQEMRELTGATPSLAASIAFGWKKQGRITTTARGNYRKVIRRDAART